MNDVEKVYRYGAYQDRTEYEIRTKAKALGIVGERLEQLIEQLKEGLLLMMCDLHKIM